MTKKRTATLVLCAALLFCVLAAGCSGPNSSPTPTITPTPTPTRTPTATPTSMPASLTVRYFYETNCPICQNFTWRVNQLEQDYLGKVTVVRINNPDAYGVSTVPTLVLLNHGVEVGRWVNPPDTTAIYAQINSLLYAS